MRARRALATQRKPFALTDEFQEPPPPAHWPQTFRSRPRTTAAEKTARRQRGFDSNELFRYSGREPEKDPARNRATGERRRANYLHPGIVSLTVFLPERRPRIFQTRRNHSWSEHRRVSKAREEIQSRNCRVALREARGRRLSQHGSHHRCGWLIARHLPEDAHSG